MSTFQETLPAFAEELRELCERYMAIIGYDGVGEDCCIEFGFVDGHASYRCNLYASFNTVVIENLTTGQTVTVERDAPTDLLQALGIELPDVDFTGELAEPFDPQEYRRKYG